MLVFELCHGWRYLCFTNWIDWMTSEGVTFIHTTCFFSENAHTYEYCSSLRRITFLPHSKIFLVATIQKLESCRKIHDSKSMNFYSENNNCIGLIFFLDLITFCNIRFCFRKTFYYIRNLFTIYIHKNTISKYLPMT